MGPLNHHQPTEFHVLRQGVLAKRPRCRDVQCKVGAALCLRGAKNDDWTADDQLLAQLSRMRTTYDSVNAAVKRKILKLL
jgi:hypothetical protein